MAVAILSAFALVIVWSSLLGLGIVLAWRGWRGRWVDRHPHCAVCDYLLVGLRVEFSGAGRTCPECGADLGAPRAIRPGCRRPAPRQVSTGIALAVIPLAAFVVALPLIWSLRTPRAWRGPVVPPNVPGVNGRLSPVSDDDRALPLPIALPRLSVTDPSGRPFLQRLDPYAEEAAEPVDPLDVARDAFTPRDEPDLDGDPPALVPRS